ncbi:MAG TPA: tRNA pseudouridine(38-40) synthase TruA [Longimicrobiales bacterium]|nr:tRNA pseudouridine(38-40) synthase TruA [Longimicrobiales bacterium]
MTAPELPAARTIRLTLHYDGGGFAGWQTQPAERTVQGELEAALARLTAGAAESVIAAGRTDRGVHATGQVVGARVPSKWTPDALARALNAVLPQDIWIAAAAGVEAGFHARYDAVARGYIYRVGTGEVAASPFLRRWCWPLRQPLRPEVLAEAATKFLGTHSFRSFAKTGQPERGERCTVYRSEWRPWPVAGIAYHVTANRFLHHMVRYMVGTMVDIARGRRPAGDVSALLAGGRGVETSPPAPAAGLCLTRVYYAPGELEHERLDETVP